MQHISEILPGVLADLKADSEAGIKARDAALRSVARNAHQPWIEMARECIKYCAQFMPTFTTDDVWAEIEDRCRRIEDGGGVAPATHEPRALGAIMRSLSMTHVITTDGDYIKSTRAQSHARPIPVWRRATR